MALAFQRAACELAVQSAYSHRAAALRLERASQDPPEKDQLMEDKRWLDYIASSGTGEEKKATEQKAGVSRSVSKGNKAKKRPAARSRSVRSTPP